MAKITYIEFGGTEHTVEVSAGLNLMEGAVKYTVPGMDGDCGGACACATCHCYIEGDEAKAKCGELDELEKDMLDFAFDVNENSRLACQIQVTDDLDGLVVKLPERQY